MSQYHPREVEMKLSLGPADLADMRRHIAAELGHAGITSRLVSVYYDTPDYELRAQGVTLRVRSAHDRKVQTTKLAGQAAVGLFSRGEWETPLDGDVPDLKAFARTPAGDIIDAKRIRVEALFETIVDRTLWMVEHQGTLIEIALDDGKVVTATRTEPLAELELELKRGSPRELFALARKLNPRGLLHPGVRAKSEVGYRLLSGKAAKPVKADPVVLDKHMTSAAAFQAVMHATLRHFCLNEPVVISHRTPESLHQARVALRRMRSALSLFKDFTRDGQLPELKRRLQIVSRDLGEARNLDVYIAHSVRPLVERNGGETGLKALLTELEARRAKAFDLAVTQLRSEDFGKLLLDLLEWIEAGPWLSDEDPARKAARERPVRALAAAVLEKQRRKVKRAGRNLDEIDPAARHRVRIEAKKLRYAAEFFTSLARKGKAKERHLAFVAALEKLQEHLGDLNDIHTGHEIVLRLAETAPLGTPPSREAVGAAAHVSALEHARVEDRIAAAAEAYTAFAQARRFWSKWPA
ncbi:CYTH and CHAD domain-containing protein [Lichenifustis flavocetrariae]|uniref:CHAD domain-containing protein n=1 Tax=Lichenifustis flavocetrariae TaxID=2949735 RepID=A0AA42CR47_9HYPH|nr:CHAD domain-containing protein [Lichenifustis flavocetrariae]MCW6512107.1 CHAD domain-containing protein [Lichenifustis flavocetrariae]